ncbi:MAG: hypothetical protein AAGJ46_18905 [Planctomycetota bacterium]
MSDNPFQAPIEGGPSDTPDYLRSARGTFTLRYVHPLQAGKVAALLYGAFALIYVPILLIAAVGSGDAQGAGAAIGALVGMFIGLIVFGFLGGLVGAFIYNLAAKSVGGLRVDFD